MTPSPGRRSPSTTYYINKGLTVFCVRIQEGLLHVFPTELCLSALSLPLAMRSRRGSRAHKSLGTALQNVFNQPKCLRASRKAQPCLPAPPHSWSKDDFTRSSGQRLNPTPILASKSPVMVWETQEPDPTRAARIPQGRKAPSLGWSTSTLMLARTGAL